MCCHPVDSDNRCRAAELRARGRAKPDRPLSENGDSVADFDATSLGSTKSSRHDVRAHQYLLVGQRTGHRREIDNGVGHTDKFGLAAVNRVPEFPPAYRFEAMLLGRPILAQATAQARTAVAARRDRAGDDLLSLAKARDGGSELLDDANRLMTDR